MAGRSPEIKREVLPAWNEFVVEAVPAGEASLGLRLASGSCKMLRDENYFSAASGAARHAREVAAGGSGHPAMDKVWDIALGARRGVQERNGATEPYWLAGPLALFAASYFEAFAFVMIVASNSLFRPGRKRRMVEDVIAACSSTVAPSGFDVIRRKMQDDGKDETTIKRRETQFRKRGATLSAPRRTWIAESDAALGYDEEGAFQTAWEEYQREEGPSRFHPAVVAGRNADARRNEPLAAQRLIVVAVLLGTLT